MDPQIESIQPGGGVVMSIESAWGRCRRWLLRKFCPTYVSRMRDLRQGQAGDLPFDPAAPRDLKYFRDPVRAVSSVLGTVVSPADGKLVQIDRADDPELGPCVRFGLFLSIFDVHANRASLPGEVVSVRDRPGKFLNALRPESARGNQNLDVVLRIAADEHERLDGAARYCRIRQITGRFARRIVCWAKPGDVFSRGEMFGMIKLGSRTERRVPDDPSLKITAEIGQRIVAGQHDIGKL